MNAVVFKREKTDDGRTVVVSRALRMAETHYIEQPDDEQVDANNLLMVFETQYGSETKRRIEELVRGGMDLDHATWQACDEDRPEPEKVPVVA